MIRTTVNKAWIKRPLRVLYGWTQTTPKDVLLDPAWDRSVDIYPGMVAQRTRSDKVTLISAATAPPMGLFGEYVGGDGVDEPSQRGINATAVWVLGPDAEFEVVAPAFLTTASWTDTDASGIPVLIHAIVDGVNRGKLVPAGTTGAGTLSTRPVARLLEVESASLIRIGGLTEGDV